MQYYLNYRIDSKKGLSRFDDILRSTRHAFVSSVYCTTISPHSSPLPPRVKPKIPPLPQEALFPCRHIDERAASESNQGMNATCYQLQLVRLKEHRKIADIRGPYFGLKTIPIVFALHPFFRQGSTSLDFFLWYAVHLQLFVKPITPPSPPLTPPSSLSPLNAP